jgi:hypothetical protein
MDLVALPLPWVERLVTLRGTRPAHTLLCCLNRTVRAALGDTHPCLVHYFAHLAATPPRMGTVSSATLVRRMQWRAMSATPPPPPPPHHGSVSQLSRDADCVLHILVPCCVDYLVPSYRSWFDVYELAALARALIFFHEHGADSHALHLKRVCGLVKFANKLGGQWTFLSIPDLCAGDALLAQRIRGDDALRSYIRTELGAQPDILRAVLPRTASAIMCSDTFVPSLLCHECHISRALCAEMWKPCAVAEL